MKNWTTMPEEMQIHRARAKNGRRFSTGLAGISRQALMLLLLVAAGSYSLYAQDGTGQALPAATKQELQAKAEKWTQQLELNDPAKEAKVAGFIDQHLMAVYTWNKAHDYQEVPAGLNPSTGQPLSELDRRIIVQSSMPASVHKALMDSLRANLTADQVEKILDDYTIGKVAFTLKGYQAIVPDLTAVETKTILANLKQAREQAIDFKSMKSISGIFEIYKTKNEQYLNANGRNWHKLFGDYVRAVKAKKAAAKEKQ